MQLDQRAKVLFEANVIKLNQLHRVAVARCADYIAAAAPATEQAASLETSVHLEIYCNAKCVEAIVTHVVVMPTFAGTTAANAADLKVGLFWFAKSAAKSAAKRKEVWVLQGRVSPWWQWGPARPLGRTTLPLAGSSSSRSPGHLAAAPKRRRNGTRK